MAVLDGGLGAWLAEDRGLDQSAHERPRCEFVGKPSRNAWITTKALFEDLDKGSFQVIDARVPERFRGEMEPIDPVAGHIPGAINLPLADNLGPDGRFLPLSQLRKRFLGALKGKAPDHLVHNCGSGVNACQNLLAMELGCLTRSRLYAGSWSEWIRSPERPVATGDQEPV